MSDMVNGSLRLMVLEAEVDALRQRLDDVKTVVLRALTRLGVARLEAIIRSYP